YEGTAYIDWTPYGSKTPRRIQVTVAKGIFEDTGSKLPNMISGFLYLAEPVDLPEIGVTISTLIVDLDGETTRVDGRVRSAREAQNLMGSLSGFSFKNATLRAGMFIELSDAPTEIKMASAGTLPNFVYKQFYFKGVHDVEIKMNATAEDEYFIGLYADVYMKAPLETLNNEGILCEPFMASFDLNGQLSGQFSSPTGEGYDDGQFLQLIVPGGAGLKVDFFKFRMQKGEITANDGSIQGDFILPFEKATYKGAGIPAKYVGGRPETNEMDALEKKGSDSLSGKERSALEESMLKYAQQIQRRGLLVLPTDTKLHYHCARAMFDLKEGWMGKGFTADNLSIADPVRITERSLDTEKQREQAIVLTPELVALDLDRESHIPAAAEGENPADVRTPKETQEDFWVGAIVRKGSLALPADFVKAKDGKPISFELVPGEMIYDLNGFNYQTYLYNDEGAPASFGSALGGFEDVTVYNCLLDMYANKINLEINAKVALEMFNNKEVNVKLYTNKEDNADRKAGEFVCSVAPTELEGALGKNTSVIISSGFLEHEGMRFAGSLQLKTGEVQTDQELRFTDMIIPAKKWMTSEAHNPQGKIASATMSSPVPIKFQGFEMLIRNVKLVHQDDGEKSDPKEKTHLVLAGSTVLSETIPIGQEATDEVIMEYSKATEAEEPKVIYDESSSVLNASFDGCIDVKGVLVPKPVEDGQVRAASAEALLKSRTPPNETAPGVAPVYAGELSKPGTTPGTIEFDTSALDMIFLSQLEVLPVHVKTRFGYDLNNERCYFAIGIVPTEAFKTIHFGDSKLEDYRGIVASNMVVERDKKEHYVFPHEHAAMAAYIDGLKVNTDASGSFAAAVRGVMVIEELFRIEDLYFGFEPGPIVRAGGDACAPIDVSSIVGNDAYRKIGTVEIVYRHPERHFSFNVKLDDNKEVLGAQ
ncbi:MAG: hypothetical protein GX900_01590, partial [Clostridiaceae bacterium]|nr:hypothetical protein [Clostridiaceae bacterium]